MEEISKNVKFAVENFLELTQQEQNLFEHAACIHRYVALATMRDGVHVQFEREGLEVFYQKQ